MDMTRDTYVDVSNPTQGPNHVRFRNVVTGIQGESQEGDTGSRLSGSRIVEPRGNGTEVCLHNERDDDNEEEEDAVFKE